VLDGVAVTKPSIVIPTAIRVTFWGALAMGITTGVGVLFGTVV
jgi:VIT1/CCC1 family predicted Fe2+/Mn2+ transporter